MKKNRCFWESKIPKLQKVLKIMKLTSILILLSVINVFAVKSYSQTTVLNLVSEYTTLKDVLHKIEEQSEFVFMYSENLIDVDRVVSVNAQDEKISNVLDDLFKGTDVDYKVKDRFIVLTTPEVSGTESSVQQIKSISGKVIDESGQPLPGVTVTVKGKTIGVITDAEGNYMISELPEGSTLVYSFVGMRTKEVEVTDQTTINIALNPDMIGLEEVVAVGYGLQKKSDVTGAMISVTSEKLNERPTFNAIEALQGRAAGVDITTNERPGEMGSIRIRGARSLTASSSPLYVVDGVPLMSSSGIETLNPRDIESIDILKDASATAIYGSRGANGVVIVTTKKGTAGKVVINYSGTVTQESLKWRSEYMDTEEYVDFVRWGAYNKSPNIYAPGNTPSLENDAKIDLFAGDPVAWENMQKGWNGTTWDPAKIETFDWMGEVTQPNLTTEHTISASGGSKDFKGYVSFGYLDNQGTTKGQEYQRYTLRTNVDVTPTKWFKFGASMNASMRYQDYGQANVGGSMTMASNLILSAAKIYPYALPYDSQGNLVAYPGGQPRVATIIDEWKYSTNQRETMRILGSIYSEITFFEGLRYRINFGPDYRSYRNGVYNDGKSVTRGGSSFAQYNGDYNFSWTLDNLLYYDKTIEKHAISATLLQTASKWNQENYSMNAQGLPTSEMMWYNMGAVTALDGWSTNLTERQLTSYMGRFNYSYDQKYMITATGRWDGASQLADGHKWSFFPSLGIGWRMEQEGFMQDIEWIDQMKLRAGYGKTGNSAIGPYTTKGAINDVTTAFGSSVAIGYTTSNDLSNFDLGWEVTEQYNMGLDFSIYKGRVNGIIDLYASNTDDLIMNMALPSVSGYTSTLANVGKTKNKGIDFTLNTVNVRNKDFSWETSINAAWNKNEIIELMREKNDMIGSGWFIGHDIGVEYTYERVGLWQDTPDDNAEMAKFNANGHNFTPGNVKVKDQNGDYKISGNDDRVILGNTAPRWTAGISNSLSYKNWDFSIFINGRMKYLTNVSEGLTCMYGDQRTVDYWTPDNTDAEYQKPYRDEAGGDGYAGTYFKDNSYLKIQNVSLGYTLPKEFVSKYGLGNVKVYVQGRNVGVLWSKIKYRDPEFNTLYYNRGFVFGLNIGF